MPHSAPTIVIGDLEHWEEYEHSDASFRPLVVSVRASDAARTRRNHDKMEAFVVREQKVVLAHPLVLPDIALESDWEGPERLDDLAPGSAHEPVSVRIRWACGHETETSVYRRDDGVWVERRYCCPGAEEKRQEVIDRHLGPEVRVRFAELLGMLGFGPDESGDANSGQEPP